MSYIQMCMHTVGARIATWLWDKYTIEINQCSIAVSMQEKEIDMTTDFTIILLFKVAIYCMSNFNVKRLNDVSSCNIIQV